MMADRLHRHWESRLLNLDPDETEEDDFEKLTAKVRREYADLADELNRAFVERFQKAGFEIDGILPQTRIFCDRVAPALAKKKKTVFFLVDALRYEMASELLEGMDKDFEVALEPAISSLPSITSIGMASLMPGAEKGMELASAKGGLTVVLEGQPLKDRKSRLAYMEEKVSGGFMALKLADVLRLGAKTKKGIEGSGPDCRDLPGNRPPGRGRRRSRRDPPLDGRHVGAASPLDPDSCKTGGRTFYHHGGPWIPFYRPTRSRDCSWILPGGPWWNSTLAFGSEREGQTPRGMCAWRQVSLSSAATWKWHSPVVFPASG